jgi:hypothetical protein
MNMLKDEQKLSSNKAKILSDVAKMEDESATLFELLDKTLQERAKLD